MFRNYVSEIIRLLKKISCDTPYPIEENMSACSAVIVDFIIVEP